MSKEIDVNKRIHHRAQLKTEVEVNDGHSHRGGLLRDISLGGAAIDYKFDANSADTPVKVGETLILKLGNETKFPARIVRVFERGFATEFDFSLTLSNS